MVIPPRALPLLAGFEGPKRWIATGMIEAQRSFRRVKGHTQMANLVTVIGAAVVNPVTPVNYAQAVA